MRLICPRCGAQYEIDDAAIPAAGREVECSACDHVWRASRPAPPPPPEAPFDPAARPVLSRPLSPAVIDILREEAARELEARAAERQALRAAARPEPDQPGAAPDDPLSAAAPAAHDAAPHEDALLDEPPPPRRIPPAGAAPVVARTQARAAAIRRRGYDSGFRLAVIAAVAALGLYAAAPHLAGQGAVGAQLMEWRQHVDRGRDWLDRRAHALIGRQPDAPHP